LRQFHQESIWSALHDYYTALLQPHRRRQA
jgi:hypothetical protein